MGANSGGMVIVAIVTGILLILIGIGIGIVNGVMFGSISASPAQQAALSFSNLEVFGFVAAGIAALVIGIVMAKDS